MTILLDTNAYLRLARHFEPLLGQKYINPPEILQVTSEVDSEVSARPRLASTFAWALEPHPTKNRLANLVTLNGPQMKEVWLARSVIEGVCQDQKKAGKFKAKGLTPPSPTDGLVLAYAYVLGCTVVADDGGMSFLSSELGITVIGSHVLLKMMMDQGKIKLTDVQALAKYLDYAKDLPGSWLREAPKLFGVKLP